MTRVRCRPRVLVVEDDRDVLTALCEVLADHDYDPRCAVNGREALDQLAHDQCPPCLILLDLMMPVMDGWQFRAAQRQDPRLAGIPVVVLTAHARIEEAAPDLAASAYLKKPVELAGLLEIVERFCHRRRGGDPAAS